MTTDSPAAYFDGVADDYDQVLPFFASFAVQAAELIEIRPGAQVLDLAAGRGALTAQLAGRAGRIVAVDAAPRMVELLHHDFPAVEVHRMDASWLEFADAIFGLVVSGFAVHILPDPLAAAAEVKRVLKPGGQFALTVPGRADGAPEPWTDPLDDLFAEYRKYQADGSGRLGNDVHVGEVLRTAGFTDVTGRTLEVAIPVPDGETYWRFTRSTGMGTFIDGLPGGMRTEFHDRLVTSVDEAGGITLRRSATLWSGRRPLDGLSSGHGMGPARAMLTARPSVADRGSAGQSRWPAARRPCPVG
jgi:SAM-dependent methyltransferase